MVYLVVCGYRRTVSPDWRYHRNAPDISLTVPAVIRRTDNIIRIFIKYTKNLLRRDITIHQKITIHVWAVRALVLNLLFLLRATRSSVLRSRPYSRVEGKSAGTNPRPNNVSHGCMWMKTLRLRVFKFQQELLQIGKYGDIANTIPWVTLWIILMLSFVFTTEVDHV